MTFVLHKEELKVACKAVVTAAKLCEAVRSQIVTLQSMTKTDRSPVTIADYGSQAIICKMLREAFPEDPVVAEEDATYLKLPDNKEQLEKITKLVVNHLGDSPSCSSVQEQDIISWIDHGNDTPSHERFWTLDPIDGTKGFLRGDQYAICLALIEQGHIKIGIIACPALELDSCIGHLFVAEQGKGAWRNSLNIDNHIPFKRIHVCKDSELFVQSFEASHGNHSTQKTVAKAVGIKTVILMDSQAKYSMVATGKAALYLRLSNYKENIWDHAAGAILVQEAGGKVSDRNGKPLIFTAVKMNENNGVVVSNGSIHEKVLYALRDN